MSDASTPTVRRKKPLLKRIFNQLLFVCITWVVCLTVGALLFYHMEHGVSGVSTLDSFYWATQIATTTGPGDVTPKTDQGKILFMIYNHLISVVLLLVLGANIIVRSIKNSDLMSHNEQEWLFWIGELIYGMVAWMVLVLYKMSRKSGIQVPNLRHQRPDGSMPPCPPQPHDTGEDGDKWVREKAEKVHS